MESRASVSNFTSPPMVLVTSPYVTHSLTHTHTHAHAHAYTPTRAHKPHTHSHMFTYFSKPLLTRPLMPPFGSISFLCLSFHTHAHTYIHPHYALDDDDSRQQAQVHHYEAMKILKSRALASCNTEDVTVMESSVSVSNFTPPLMVMVPSLYVTYSFFVHISKPLLTGLSMLPLCPFHTLPSAYLVTQTQHTCVLLIVLSP